MYGSEAWAITKALARQLDAFYTWSLRKILQIPYKLLDTLPTLLSRRLLAALQFQVLLKQEFSASLATWHVQIPGKIITELSVRRFDHQETGGDLEGARVPPGWGGLMPMYSRQKHRYPLSLEEGQWTCSLESGDTPLGARHWRRSCNCLRHLAKCWHQLRRHSMGERWRRTSSCRHWLLRGVSRVVLLRKNHLSTIQT